MLVSAYPDYQVILKKDGSHRVTSVAKHTEFVRSPTRRSDDLAGRVKFNESPTGSKWWRFVRIGTTSPIEQVCTMLIELLCASAFDRLAVEPTYTETLPKLVRVVCDGDRPAPAHCFQRLSEHRDTRAR